MSASPGGENPRVRFPLLALLAALGWGGLLALLWSMKPEAGEPPNEWWIFLGRFHPLIVHAPIGLLLVIPVVEVLGRCRGNGHFRDTVPLMLWLAALGTAGATAAGYLLMQGEQIESDLMDKHLWSGVVCGGLVFLTLMLRLRGEGILYLGSLLASVGVLSLAGHYGGALVHGPAYLAKHAPAVLKPLLMAGLEDPSAVEHPGNGETPGAPPANGEGHNGGEVPLADRVVFADFVLPILDAKCNECHNENKTKGKLRLDTHELILAGAEGSDYPTVEPGKSDESELLTRVLLPADHDDYMPPDGKPAMTPEEIKIIRWWINTGASSDATVAALEADDEINTALLATRAALEGDAATAAAIAGSGGAISEWDLLSPEMKQERIEAVKAAAGQFHFTVTPISADDDRLKISVLNAAQTFGDEQLALLDPVAERIVWLDLARSQVTDTSMKTVGRMRHLVRLHLENTKITDAGVAELTRLGDLEYLNLYGTGVTSAIFEPLASLRGLKKLYLFQTKVDPNAARAFQKSMSLEVNLGTGLETPPKPGPAKPITAPPPAKKEEPKKAEAKQEAPKPAVEAKKEAPPAKTGPPKAP